MKKRILCFGDSNTFGSRPTGGRFDENIRWPMRMAQLLGSEYTVVEEGFGGRTTVFDDPVEGGYKSGAAYLPPCLMSHNPLDLVILMLGTNDLKMRFNMNARTIAEGNMRLIRLIMQYAMTAEGATPKILLVAPPVVGDWIMHTRFADVFGAEAPDKSKKFAAEFARYARLMRCEFLDASLYAEPSKEDALHLNQENHLRLAEAMARKVREILK
jgi:lysophospholipase L1-like esterase